MTARLHFETLGVGTAIVILHGLFGSGRNWFSIAKTLAKNYQLIIPDARNHGKSRHRDSMSYQEMAEDLHQLLAHLNLSAVHLIGHSMGGKTAMTFALHYPQRLKSLSVLDIAPVKYHSDFDHLIAHMQNLDLQSIQSRQQANDTLAAHIRDDGLRAFLLNNLAREQEGFRWRINLPVIRSALAEICHFPVEFPHREYNGPTLFLSGRDSDYMQPEYETDIHKLFPHAKLESIHNAKHWLHADQPAQVVRQLLAFFADAA